MPVPPQDHRWKAASARTWKVDRADVKRKLRELNDPVRSAESKRMFGGYSKFRLEMIPISRINVKPMWHPGRPEPLRKRMQVGLPIDPVRLSLDETGRYDIGDGIHRTNVAIEMGYSHVPAIVSEWVETPDEVVAPESQKSQLALGSWVHLHEPFDRREYGWVDEHLGTRPDRGVKRWMYGIALVKPGDTYPHFADFRDTELEPCSPPPWGEIVRRDCLKP